MNIDDNGAIRSVEVFQVVNTNDQPLNIDGRNLTYSGGEYYGVMDDPSDNTKQAIVQLQTSSSSSSGGDNWNETESYELRSLIFTDNNDNYSTDAIEQFFDNASINYVKQTDSSQSFRGGGRNFREVFRKSGTSNIVVDGGIGYQLRILFQLMVQL